MTADEVAQRIEAGLKNCRALVQSGDNVHFEAVVIAPDFAGKRPLQRHQLVYATLGSAVGNEIHALQLHVFTPEEYASQNRG